MTIPNSEKQKRVTVTVNLSAEQSEHLKNIAVIKCMDVDGLINKYIEEQLDNDMPILRRKEYFNHLKEVLKEHNVPHVTIKTLEDNFLY